MSFETGMTHLGGSSLFLGEDVGWGSRESIGDFGRVLSEFVDVIVVRAFKHQTAIDLGRYCTCSVINGLTDFSHPCQALADLYTVLERFGTLQGLKIAFVGDANNVARSLAEGCGKLGVTFACAAPKGYQFTDEDVARLKKETPKIDLQLTDDPKAAVRGAHAVYTDVWTSMGQEAERAERQKGLRRLSGERRVDEHAPKDALFMHCLPAHRGEEVTDEVMDGPQASSWSRPGTACTCKRACWRGSGPHKLDLYRRPSSAKASSFRTPPMTTVANPRNFANGKSSVSTRAARPAAY